MFYKVTYLIKLIAISDTICWTVTPGYHIMGLTNMDKKSLPECLDECVRSVVCKAVDWDTKMEKSCFVQTNKDLEVFKSKLLVKKSVTNFLLNRECLADLLLA